MAKKNIGTENTSLVINFWDTPERNPVPQKKIKRAKSVLDTIVRPTREVISDVKKIVSVQRETSRKIRGERESLEEKRLQNLLQEIRDAGISLDDISAICEFFESRGKWPLKITKDRNPQLAQFPSIWRWQTNRLNWMLVVQRIAQWTPITVRIRQQNTLENIWKRLYSHLWDIEFRKRERQAVQEIYYDRQVELIEENTGIKVDHTWIGFRSMVWSAAIQLWPESDKIYKSILKLQPEERRLIGTSEDIWRKIEIQAIEQAYKDRISFWRRLAERFEENVRVMSEKLWLVWNDRKQKNIFTSLWPRYRDELLLVQYLNREANRIASK